MCIPTLCPFCSNNKTCAPRVPIKLITFEEAKLLPNDELELEVRISGMSDRIQICTWLNDLLNLAMINNAGRIAILVDPTTSCEQLQEFSAIINCRAIIKFNHDINFPQSLKEIRIICGNEQVAALKQGLTHQHPLCLGCFEKRCPE